MVEFFVYLMTRFPIDPRIISDIDKRVSATASSCHFQNADVIRFLSQWNVLELLPQKISDFMRMVGVPTSVSDKLTLDEDHLNIAIKFMMMAVLDYDEQQILKFNPNDGDSARIALPPSSRAPEILSVVNGVPLITITKRSGEVIESLLSYKSAPMLFFIAAKTETPDLDALVDVLHSTRNYEWLLPDNADRGTNIVFALQRQIQERNKLMRPFLNSQGIDGIQCTNSSDVQICIKIINESLNEVFEGSRQRVHSLAYIIRTAYLELIGECGTSAGDRANPDYWRNGLGNALTTLSVAELEEFMSRHNK